MHTHTHEHAHTYTTHTQTPVKDVDEVTGAFNLGTIYRKQEFFVLGFSRHRLGQKDWESNQRQGFHDKISSVSEGVQDSCSKLTCLPRM